MKAYLIAEEGPLAGMTIAFEEEAEKNEWVLGRDPETSDVALEDPMVSRKHVIVRLTPEGFTLENLSSVNPATQNGMVIDEEPILLKEGDIIQIGSTFFHFSEKEPEMIPEEEPIEVPEEVFEKEEPAARPLSELHFGPSPDTRWLLKVISGPNSGAEFAMHKGDVYLIGKDANICDVVFQDLSVSRQHARLSIDEEENAFIEDLGSRNGVIVNGELIDEKQLLTSQDLVALGTTTFLVIDRHEARETIISPAMEMPKIPLTKEALAAKKIAEKKRDWKEQVIPKRFLIVGAVFAGVLFISVFGILTLFRSEPITIVKIDESEKIKEVLDKFEGVVFSFNQPSGKLFLTGNVETTVQHQELIYLLNENPSIRDIDNNVIVDELVWQNMNALLSKNPEWIGVSMYSPTPGRYVLRGYLQTLGELEALDDYLHLNFDYLDRLEMMVVVEKNLQMELESMLLGEGFSAVSFELSNGEVVLSGRADKNRKRVFNKLIDDLKKVPGVRVVKNYVVISEAESVRVNLSTQYAVTGFSKRDDKDIFVVIGGRILGKGDMLDGMLITKVKPKTVLLEKEGMQYRIHYNMQ